MLRSDGTSVSSFEVDMEEVVAVELETSGEKTGGLFITSFLWGVTRDPDSPKSVVEYTVIYISTDYSQRITGCQNGIKDTSMNDSNGTTARGIKNLPYLGEKKGGEPCISTPHGIGSCTSCRVFSGDCRPSRL